MKSASCDIDGKLTPKKNRLTVRRSGTKTWIAPDNRAKADQAALAWELRSKLPRFTGAVSVSLRLPHGTRADLDNLLGGLFDALQTSGIVENDKCITRVEAYIDHAIERPMLKIIQGLATEGERRNA
jgi:Holliday junction resolvase RusA-like endonuclease